MINCIEMCLKIIMLLMYCVVINCKCTYIIKPKLENIFPDMYPWIAKSVHKIVVGSNLPALTYIDTSWHLLWQRGGADIETSLCLIKICDVHWQTCNLCNHAIHKHMRRGILVFFKFLICKMWMQKFPWTGPNLQIGGFIRLCSTGCLECLIKHRIITHFICHANINI